MAERQDARRTKTGRLVKLSLVPRFSMTPRRPLNLHFTKWNLVAPPRDSVCRSHIHDNYELIAPVSGPYSCLLNGVRLALKSGKVIFIQPGDSHEDYYRQGSSFVGFHFQLRDFAMGLWTHGVLDKGVAAEAHVLDVRKRTWPGRISDMIATMMQECRPKNRLSELTVDALSDAFFWSLVSTIPETDLSPQFRNCQRDDEFRGKIAEVFAQAVLLKLTAAKMASLFGMSERSLDYKFASVIGASPAKSFTIFKLDKAAEMLEGGATVKEAAETLGFADPFHFSKVFKRHLGTTPSSLRK